MKPFITALIWTLALIPGYAGDVTDLGPAPKVPDWAVGPLLVKGCVLQTEKEANGYYRIHLSQALFDQTYYHIIIEWLNGSGKEPEHSEQFAVWDTKSRK